MTEVKPGQSLLEMRGIVKEFSCVRALGGVDLDVRPGEVHALVGQNGAGKSTVIRVLAGAHQPDGGTISRRGGQVLLSNPVAAMRLGIDFESMNEPQFHDHTEDAETAGFRRILVTEPAHPYAKAWWPPGHGLGHEHTFTHEVVERSAASGSGWDLVAGLGRRLGDADGRSRPAGLAAV